MRPGRTWPGNDRRSALRRGERPVRNWNPKNMADFFAIDVGSSFLKGALIDPDAFELRHTERVPFPEFEPGLPPLHREVNPAAILGAVEELVARLWRLSGRCDGVVLCGQMHGVILVDERGEAVSNYISWLDQRVPAGEFERIAERVTPAERTELGYEFRSSIGVSLLYWLARHGCLPAGPVTPVSIADYVAGKLTGAMPVMEPTQAAAFGALRLGHPRMASRGDRQAGARWTPMARSAAHRRAGGDLARRPLLGLGRRRAVRPGRGAACRRRAFPEHRHGLPAFP